MVSATRVVIAATLLAAVSSPRFVFAQTESAGGAVISGRLEDTVGCPVIDAVVRVRLGSNPAETGYFQETRSDSDGAFAFQPIAPGHDYWIRYDLMPAGGWGGTTVTLRPAGAHLVQRWPKPMPGDLLDFDFVVADLDNEPVRGARLTWHRLLGSVESNCVSGTATTDARGRAVEPRVAPGRYRVTVDADGFAPQTIDAVHEWGQQSLNVRLLTPEEAEKARKSRVVTTVCGPAPPNSITTLVAASDAVVVARITRARLDADYTTGMFYPTVRTLYDIQLIETIKPSVRMKTSGGGVSIMHSAGEFDLGDTIVLGLERTPMREGELYVMFLVWNDYYNMLMPSHASAFLANITTGVVAPMRRTREISPVIARRQGIPAAQFLQEIKSAVR